MFGLIAWFSIGLGIATLLGTSKALNSWQLKLSFGTTDSGGQLFLFVLGIFLLIGGVTQLFSQSMRGR